MTTVLDQGTIPVSPTQRDATPRREEQPPVIFGWTEWQPEAGPADGQQPGEEVDWPTGFGHSRAGIP